MHDLFIFSTTASKKPVDILKILLEIGLNPNQRHGVDTPLTYVMKHRDLFENEYDQIIELLLKQGNNQNQETLFGESLLLLAMRWGTEKTIQCLLEYKANPNSADIYGNTSLLVAIEQHYGLDTIVLLLDHKANPNHISIANEESPLLLAVQRFKGSTIKSYSELVSLLLKHGANPNQDIKGESPLSLAIKLKNPDLFKLLLSETKHTIDFNKKLANEKTLLLLAVEYNQPNIVRLLLSHKADATLADDKGVTPLKLAKKENSTEIVWLFEPDKKPSFFVPPEIKSLSDYALAAKALAIYRKFEKGDIEPYIEEAIQRKLKNEESYAIGHIIGGIPPPDKAGIQSRLETAIESNKKDDNYCRLM